MYGCNAPGAPAHITTWLSCLGTHLGMNLSVRQALCTSLHPNCAVTSNQRGALPAKGSDAGHRLVAAQSGGGLALSLPLPGRCTIAARPACPAGTYGALGAPNCASDPVSWASAAPRRCKVLGCSQAGCAAARDLSQVLSSFWSVECTLSAAQMHENSTRESCACARELRR